MRLHIELDEELVARIEELSRPRRRSAFVRSAVERAIRQDLRWSDIEAVAAAIEDQDHEWDPDPAAWVRRQRRAGARRAR
jgi:metal-responsive CopG/Arc/MetJ family transcriptional regulator